MSGSSEQHWLERIRAGDGSAMGEMLAAHQERLFNVCLRMLSNRDDAAEATQEAMLKIVEHIGSFRGRSQLATWMIRIAMNQATTRLRQRKRRPALSLDGHGNGAGHDGEDGILRQTLTDKREPSPAAGVEEDERHRQLHEALASLDEPLRAVLVLRDIDGLDYGQIGEVLQMPTGTVKSRLFRARLALRERLQAMDAGHTRRRTTQRPGTHDG